MAKKTKKQQLQDLIDVQASNGNWDYDPYMHGLLNGMHVAMSLLTNEPPEFVDAPKQFISDTEILNKIKDNGVVLK